MKIFDYKEKPKTLLKPDIVAMLTSIHEHKGRQELHIESHTDMLSALMETAKIQSTGASNAIEGIHTTDKRLSEIVHNKSVPRNRTEQEIAGYRDVLAVIHESYDYIHPNPNTILQLHKQMYSYVSSSIGGSYKNSDNFISETDIDGRQTIRFKPVPAFMTPSAMDSLSTAFKKSTENGEFDMLLLIPMFILDFLCIHPFNDGNGRMSRLLTLLLFYRAGYIAGKYISLEKLIENSKDTYYEALMDSSDGWHDNQNDYTHFVRYYLGILQKAYNVFEERIEHLQNYNLSKPERIKILIDKKIGNISKREILEMCPDISKITVERTLNALVKSGYLIKTGGGPSIAYLKNQLLTSS